MKTQKFNFALVLFTFLAASTYAYAAGEELTKTFHKEYDVKAGTVLNVQNKFGNINVVTWDKPQVVIDVKVTLEHPDKEKAAKLIDMIKVNFSEEGNSISVITEIDEKFSNMQTGWGSNQKEFSIDYDISMPKDLTLNLLNKYGSIYADELAGLVNIEVKYGKLTVNKITRGSAEEKSLVTVGYSECTIDEANWLKVDIKYSKIKINTAEVLGIMSKYSELNISEAKSMVVESKYDVFKVGHVGIMKGESDYTSYSFQQVDKKFELVTAYGNLTIDRIPAGFESIDFTGKYTKFAAFIDPDASYSINGSAEYAKIRVPENNRLSRIIENTKQTLSGTIGSNPNPTAKVNINTKYGEVVLTR
jgi:hypothetical protein